ncbi:MAG: class I SAM-dependent methyltransferase [Pseudomonadota bacterium]
MRMPPCGVDEMITDWDWSAEAWLTEQGDAGDWGRRYVLDRVMMGRVRAGSFRNALDVGCGEGRFCRMLAEEGIKTTGIDPTERLLATARERDMHGDYRTGRAEHLDLPDGSFDLIVSYLSLVDIPDLTAAVSEIVRVCAPGGTILIANLTSYNTAGQPEGWRRRADGELAFAIDRYQDERPIRGQWRGIDILNHHRPMRTCMQAFLAAGLRLTFFDEPLPDGYPPENEEKAARYRRVPYFLVMEWRKPREISDV